MAAADAIKTQQPTGLTEKYNNERMRMVGEGGAGEQKQHNNQPKST